jgi:hypothetical protein
MTGTPDPLEDRLGERGDLIGELSRYGVLNGHVRALTTGRPQTLAREQRLGSNPVSIVSGRVGAVDVTQLQSRRRGGLCPAGGPLDQGARQRAQVPGLNWLKTATVDEELNRPLTLLPTSHRKDPPSRRSSREPDPTQYRPPIASRPARADAIPWPGPRCHGDRRGLWPPQARPKSAHRKIAPGFPGPWLCGGTVQLD